MADELSAEAKAICEQHYNFKSRASCNPCPLISECHKPSKGGSQAELNEWRGRLNALAQTHSKPLPFGPHECAQAQLDIFAQPAG